MIRNKIFKKKLILPLIIIFSSSCHYQPHKPKPHKDYFKQNNPQSQYVDPYQDQPYLRSVRPLAYGRYQLSTQYQQPYQNPYHYSKRKISSPYKRTKPAPDNNKHQPQNFRQIAPKNHTHWGKKTKNSSTPYGKPQNFKQILPSSAQKQQKPKKSLRRKVKDIASFVYGVMIFAVLIAGLAL